MVDQAKMIKTWRPEGWKNPYADKVSPPIVLFDPGLESERQMRFDRDCIVARLTYEAGADAMYQPAYDKGKADGKAELLAALRAKGAVLDPKEGGKWVFIPNDKEGK